MIFSLSQILLEIIDIFVTTEEMLSLSLFYLIRFSYFRKFDRAVIGAQFVLTIWSLRIANHTVSHCSSSSRPSEFMKLRILSQIKYTPLVC